MKKLSCVLLVAFLVAVIPLSVGVQQKCESQTTHGLNITASLSLNFTSAEARSYGLCNGGGALYGIGAAACAACIAATVWATGDYGVCFGSAAMGPPPQESSSQLTTRKLEPAPTPKQADADGLSGQR